MKVVVTTCPACKAAIFIVDKGHGEQTKDVCPKCGRAYEAEFLAEGTAKIRMRMERSFLLNKKR